MSIVKHVGTDDFVHTYQVYVTDLQKAIEIAEWGTYGKGGNEPLKYVRLISSSDCCIWSRMVCRISCRFCRPASE